MALYNRGTGPAPATGGFESDLTALIFALCYGLHVQEIIIGGKSINPRLMYSIIALDAALDLTVPVSRSSKQTKGQQKAKAEKRRREAESHKEGLQRPRLN